MYKYRAINMEKVTVDTDASFTETFHDCNSQPTSPRPAEKDAQPQIKSGEGKENMNGLSHKEGNNYKHLIMAVSTCLAVQDWDLMAFS